jgi:versiconal hemiacetal acetate esterase
LGESRKLLSHSDSSGLLTFQAYNNASTLNGDCEKYFTVGQSAGGNLALAVARRLIVLGRKNEVKGIAAIAPFVVHPDGVPSCYKTQYRSFDELGDGPINTKQAMTQFYGWWCLCINKLSFR